MHIALPELVVTAACRYMDDPPNNYASDGNWIEFCNDVPLKKIDNYANPQHYLKRLLEWVQNKYVSLGASTCVITSVSSSNLKIVNAAVQLGIDLTQNGNKRMQQSVLADFEQPQYRHMFFTAVSHHLDRVSIHSAVLDC